MQSTNTIKARIFTGRVEGAEASEITNEVNGLRNGPEKAQSRSKLFVSTSVWHNARRRLPLLGDVPLQNGSSTGGHLPETEEIYGILRRKGRGKGHLYRLELSKLLPNDCVKIAEASYDGEDVEIKILTSCPKLTEVILTTDHPDTFRLAKENIRQWSSALRTTGFICREAEVLDLSTPEGHAFHLSLQCCSPTSQGALSKGTKLIITTSLGPTQSFHNGTLTPNDNDFDIEESFLANSITTPISHHHLQHAAPAQQTNGDHQNVVDAVPSFSCEAGSFSSIADSICKHLHAETDPDAVGLVTIAQIARYGIFSGDWIEIAPKDFASARRLIQIQAMPNSCSLTRSSTGSALDRIWLSSTLLSNLSQKRNDVGGSGLSVVLKRPHPRYHAGPPTAKSLVIETVASPFVMDKRNALAVSHALRHEFEAKMKVVSNGDLICVPFSQNYMRILSELKDRAENHEESEESNGAAESREQKKTLKEGTLDGEETLFHAILPGHHERHNAAIFFKVKDIKVEEIGNIEGHSISSFVVDPTVSKMVQSGITQSYTAGWTPPGTRAYSKIYRKLRNICTAALAPQASDHHLQATILITGRRGCGKRYLLENVASELGLHFLELNCYDLLGESDIKTEALLQARLEKAKACRPCLVLLRHIDAFARKNAQAESGQDPKIVVVLKEAFAELQNVKSESEVADSQPYPIVIAGTTSESEKVPLGLLNCFDTEFKLNAPDEAERLQILGSLAERSSFALAADVSLKTIAMQTAGLVARDLVELNILATRALGQRCLAANPTLTMDEIQSVGSRLTEQDLTAALGQVRKSYSDSIGAPKIPNVTWDDVGGLADVKQDILDTIQLPMDHPELFASGLKKRSGILLYGPPGTGKTLLAKAVATSCSLNFFSIKGPELLNMYIGESEANVRRVFAKARDAKPCVIFFDELDSVAPKRGNQGDSGGVMDRIVSQLLAELDGMSDTESAGNVFVIGATNRPDLLDPALLRPGRFDKMLFLSVSETHEAQHKIIHALTRKFLLDPDLDLVQVANRCPMTLTGADFYALCSDALLNAMTRLAQEVDLKVEAMNRTNGERAQPPDTTSITAPHRITPQYYLEALASPSETRVVVTLADFDKALREMTPSVSELEMEHYRRVQENFASSTLNKARPNADDKDASVETAAVDAVSRVSTSYGKGKGKARVYR